MVSASMPTCRLLFLTQSLAIMVSCSRQDADVGSNCTDAAPDTGIFTEIGSAGVGDLL